MNAKTSLRQELRRQRRLLDPLAQADASLACTRWLCAQREYLRAERIAAYIAVDGELDLAPFIERALAAGKHIFLPRLSPITQRSMEFLRYDPARALIPNRYGIPEPDAGAGRIRPLMLDLVLAPLVAFDHSGNRIGMGGGHYDRCFAFRNHQRHWRKPTLVGVAHHFQEVPQLPAAAWDVPLDAVVTDHAWLSISDGRVNA